MKGVGIASVGLAISFILTSGAHAGQPSTTISLVQKLQPEIRSYPKVEADILGIRTGMTVSQAEAAAEKSFPGKPQEIKDSYFFTYREVRVLSHPFIQTLRFSNKMNETIDKLSLYFGSPAAGNTVDAIGREITFGDNGNFGGDPAKAPLMRTIEDGLIKKYGRPSYRTPPNNGFSAIFAWTFSTKSSVPCEAGCIDGNFRYALNPATTSSIFDGVNMGSIKVSDLSSLCGQVPNYPSTFTIYAFITPYSSDPTKAQDMQISIWDAEACADDSKEAMDQLKAAAIKFYDSVSKTPVTPKF